EQHLLGRWCPSAGNASTRGECWVDAHSLEAGIGDIRTHPPRGEVVRTCRASPAGQLSATPRVHLERIAVGTTCRVDLLRSSRSSGVTRLVGFRWRGWHRRPVSRLSTSWKACIYWTPNGRYVCSPAQAPAYFCRARRLRQRDCCCDGD